MASLDFLSAALAARGARNPDALAAWLTGGTALANDYAGVIDLDWATWDAEHGSGGGSKAHDTASATAKATAKRHMASKAARARQKYGSYKAKSASQLKSGHHILIGNKGTVEDHKVLSTSRNPSGGIRVKTQAPDGSTHVHNMRPTAQVSYNPAISPTLANPDLGIYLAADGDAPIPSGGLLKCPACGHEGTGSAFGASGASQDRQPGLLRTPARKDGAAHGGFQPGSSGVQPKAGNAAHALANGGTAIGLAGTLAARRNPVKSPVDVIVARGEDGQAVIRHRQGGATIAGIRKNDDGTWTATVDGRDLAPHAHQRTALMEAVGTYNKAVAGIARPAAAPLQPPPEQTPLMAEYGIPAIRMATPATGASAGPRITMAGGDGDGTDDDGLTPRGQAIKKKLMAKGFPEARAITFAKMSQKTKPGAFGKQAAA